MEETFALAQCALNAPPESQLEAPIEYEQYISVARTIDADQTFWRNLLPKATASGIAFVLETRLGAVSCGLAPHFSRVLSWHRSAAAAVQTQRYADQQQLKNIQVIVAKEIIDVDLPKAQIDVFVFYGPSCDLTSQWGMDIELLLDTTLKHVESALADSSMIVIAENNRWNYRTKRPQQPNDIGRVGIALLPLRRQFRKRFVQNESYVCQSSMTSSQMPLPDFVKFDLPSNGLHIPKTQAAKVKGRLLNCPAVRLFWPAFLMITTNASRASLAEELIHQQEVAAIVGWDAADCIIVKRVVAGNSGTTIVVSGPSNRDSADVVLRMPSRAASIRRCHVNAAALLRLANSPLSGLIPRLVCQGDYQGREYSIESRCSGYEIDYGTRNMDGMIRRACLAIGELHFKTTSFTPIDAALFESLVTPHFADIYSYSSPAIQARLNKLAESLRLALMGETVALGFVHGDFKVSNMLFDRSGNFTALIDWDGFSENGAQIFDYLTLLVYKIANERQIGLTEAYIEDILPWTLRASDAALVEDAIGKLMVNERSFLMLRIVFWFALLNDRIDHVYKSHAEWHRRYVLPVMPKLESVLFEMSNAL